MAMGLRRVGKGKSKRGSRDHTHRIHTADPCVFSYSYDVYRYVRLSSYALCSPEVPLLRYAKTKVRLPALTPLAHIESPSCLTDLILARIPCEEKQVVAHLFERCDAIVDAPAAHEL